MRFKTRLLLFSLLGLVFIGFSMVYGTTFEHVLVLIPYIFIGYWFLFKSETLYNCFALIRYGNKKSFYLSFLKTELVQATIIVLVFTIVTIVVRIGVGLALPFLKEYWEPLTLTTVFLFVFTYIVNIVLLRFCSLLLMLLFKRFWGNVFYVGYVVLSMLVSIFISDSPHNLNLLTIAQIYNNQVVSVPQIVASYGIIAALIALLIWKIKKSSVRV